jgi:hypothetical protein
MNMNQTLDENQIIEKLGMVQKRLAKGNTIASFLHVVYMKVSLFDDFHVLL